MNKLPKARNKNIIIQNAENEILVYDTVSNQAYCLNETSAKVFNACDGTQTFAELKRKHQFTDELIFLALDELKRQNLLADDAQYLSPFAGMSRREVIRKVGFATMIALPLIAGIVAPKAINAASGGGQANLQTCSANSQCASNSCRTTNNGTQRCCASTVTSQPQEPGTNLGNTTNNICTNIIGPQFCCSGSATNNPPGSSGCVCDS